MKCNAKPYEGKESYIFFSYCHDDEGQCYPIIEQLTQAGYRIWYDDGLHPGDDWPDVIAEKLDKCEMCMVAISKRFSASHNCKNELTFAINEKKPLIVIEIEKYMISIGMRLQLANTQRVKRYDYPDLKSFCEEIYSSKLQVLGMCKGKERPDVVVNQEVSLVVELEKKKPILPVMHIEQEKEPDKTLEDKNSEKLEPVKSDEKKEAEEEEQVVSISASKPTNSEVVDARETQSLETEEKIKNIAAEENTFINREDSGDDMESVTQMYIMEEDDIDDEGRTMMLASGIPPLIIRVKTKEYFWGKYPLTALGRDKTSCDVAFPDKKTMGRHHADIVVVEGDMYVLDRGSVNKTYVNGIELEKNGRCQIQDIAELKLADEELYILTGDTLRTMPVRFLFVSVQSDQTKESRILLKDEMILGRSYAWQQGVLADHSVSRKHAILSVENEKCYLQDISSYHMTWINNVKTEADKRYLLSNGDKIRICDDYFTVTLIPVEKNEE